MTISSANTTFNNRCEGISTHPSCNSRLAQVYRAAIVREVCKHDAEINESGEDAGAKASNRGWGNLCKIDRPNDNGLADAQTSYETTGVDGTQVAFGTHENGNTENPNDAELTSCPDTADTIADKESTIF